MSVGHYLKFPDYCEIIPAGGEKSTILKRT